MNGNTREPNISELPSACCCYTVNEGYLFPTLLSALQARRHASKPATDIILLCFGHRTEATDIFAALCVQYGIRFLLVPTGELGGMPMTFARFFLSGLLDARYEQILYIDGDTQVSASLDPLTSVDLAPGKVLAAFDPMAIMINSPAKAWRARRRYFVSIGLSEARLPRYFNAGVMRFRRDDWSAISTECLRLCRSQGRDFRFRDQDALNLVIGDDHLPLSFKWNFPSFFLNCGVEASIEPHIYHFMSNPRPWDGPFAPWGAPWHAIYRSLAHEHPELARFFQPLRSTRYLKYLAQQRFKQVVERRIWGTPEIRGRIARIESQAYV